MTSWTPAGNSSLAVVEPVFLQKWSDDCLLEFRWEAAGVQRFIEQRGQERWQQVTHILDQPQRGWVQLTRFVQRRPDQLLNFIHSYRGPLSDRWRNPVWNVIYRGVAVVEFRTASTLFLKKTAKLFCCSFVCGAVVCPLWLSSDAYFYTEVSATCFVANMSMPTITHDDNKTYTLATIFHNIEQESGSKRLKAGSGLWPMTRPRPKLLTRDPFPSPLCH